MAKLSNMWKWALVLTTGSLSAIERDDFSADLGERGEQVFNGLGTEGTTGGSLEEKNRSKPEEDKKVDIVIQGAFCVITFLLFTAGYIGTKSHKGARVATLGLGETKNGGGFCGKGK